MHKPMGRSDDMMVVKGVNVWPSQIEAVLLKQGYQANYQILVDRIGNNDTIEVQVEMTPEMKQEDVAIAAREKKIVHGLKQGRCQHFRTKNYYKKRRKSCSSSR